MDKQSLLLEVTQAAREKTITLPELDAAYAAGANIRIDSSVRKHLNVSDVMYLVGALIVVTGIGVLIGQSWDVLPVFARILATFGASLVAFFSGLVLSKRSELSVWSSAFYLVSSIVMPIGVYAIFDAVGIKFVDKIDDVWFAALIVGLHVSALLITRKGIHVIFTVIYSIWLYYTLLAYLLGPEGFGRDTFAYLTLVLGIALTLIGYGLSKTQFNRLAGVHYAAGVSAFLGSVIALQHFSPTANLFWEGIFPILAFGLIFLSSALKSRAVLIFSALMLMAYIIKLTGEYFSENLGWPLALVIAGLLLMVVGYAAFAVDKRYLKKAQAVV